MPAPTPDQPGPGQAADRLVRRAAALYLVIGLGLQGWRILTLNASYDQGTFLQEIWNGLRGHPFESSLASQLSSAVLVHGTALPSENYLHLAMHFTPLLILWLPLVALLGVWSLPLIQVGGLTAGGLVLHRLARQELARQRQGERLAAWITVSYFAAGMVIGPALENFHDFYPLPLLVFTLMLGISRRQLALYLPAALLLPIVREDVGILAFGIGVWMVLRRPHWRWWGVGLAAYALLYVLVVTTLVMPALGSEISERFMAERFGQFLHGDTGSTWDVLLAMARQPLLVLAELIQPLDRSLRFLVTIGLPLALVPFLSIDVWLLMALPLFIALVSQGKEGLSVFLRFVLLLVPGVFSGTVFWWRRHGGLFERARFRRLWQAAIGLSLLFCLSGNPHRSLSFLVPDSVEPWVHFSPAQLLQRGLATRAVLATIPADASVSADTQLVPLLATRPVLLRFPHSTSHRDRNGQRQEVSLVVSQPRLLADYAPAFLQQARWFHSSARRLTALVAGGTYGVRTCTPTVIVLQRGLDSGAAGQACLARELAAARAQLQRRGDASDGGRI
ncbi:MAG: DUF2079 domain-containing protein [Synechococcaceae cyanobacterium]